MADKDKKQMKLDTFIKRIYPDNPKPNRKRQHNGTSRQNSETEEIQIEDSKQFVPQMILITALDNINSEVIFKKLKSLMEKYTKAAALDVIANNAKFYGIKNVNNLAKIQDAKFWNVTLPKVLKFVIDYSDQIKAKVDMLPKQLQKVISITKRQALLIISQMFFCIIPRQSTQNCTNLGRLFQVAEAEQGNDYDTRPLVRLQKIKCIIQYLKQSFERKIISTDPIQFYRAISKDRGYLSSMKKRKIQLSEVFIVSQAKIEDYYGTECLVDFANQSIGGGVLGNGAIQQQILFVIFPELLVAKLIADKLDDQDAIIIYGAERFSEYKGYSDDFKFAGPYKSKIPAQEGFEKQYNNSIIIAIDAINFSKKEERQQYNKKNIRRQIHKAYTGFEGARYKAPQSFPICTGKWGCGAFKGNQHCKLLIQWIACSEAGVKMTFITGKETQRQLKRMVKELKDLKTFQILSILDQYGDFITKKKAEISLIQYIKQFV